MNKKTKRGHSLQKEYRLTEAMRVSAMPQMDQYKGGDGDISDWKTKFHTPSLDDCFKELRVGGWTAEKDWTCCGTCGHHEMKIYFPGKPYVFYSQQSAEDLNNTGKVCLKWSDNGKGFKRGKELYETLKAYNLKPIWNGEADRAMEITVRGDLDVWGEKIDATRKTK